MTAFTSKPLVKYFAQNQDYKWYVNACVYVILL